MEGNAHQLPDRYFAMKHLEQEVDNLEKQVMEAEEAIRKATLVGRTSDPEDSQGKIIRIKAEKLTLQKSLPINPPVSAQVQNVVMKAELKADKERLEALVGLLKVESQQKEQKLVQLEEAIEQLKTIRSAIEDRVNRLQSASQTQQTENRKEIRARIFKMKNHSTTNMEMLEEFISKHYPDLTEEDIKKYKKKNPSTSFTASHQEALSMTDILEAAVGQALEHPGDPYLKVTSDQWPPYLETLYRVGIIQYHPNNPNRYKLVDML